MALPMGVVVEGVAEEAEEVVAEEEVEEVVKEEVAWNAHAAVYMVVDAMVVDGEVVAHVLAVVVMGAKVEGVADMMRAAAVAVVAVGAAVEVVALTFVGMPLPMADGMVATEVQTHLALMAEVVCISDAMVEWAAVVAVEPSHGEIAIDRVALAPEVEMLEVGVEVAVAAEEHACCWASPCARRKCCAA